MLTYSFLRTPGWTIPIEHHRFIPFMNVRWSFLLLAACVLFLGRDTPIAQPTAGILIRGGTVVDGSGTPKRPADVRIVDDKIAEVGKLSPKSGERVIDAT